MYDNPGFAHDLPTSPTLSGVGGTWFLVIGLALVALTVVSFIASRRGRRYVTPLIITGVLWVAFAAMGTAFLVAGDSYTNDRAHADTVAEWVHLKYGFDMSQTDILGAFNGEVVVVERNGEHLDIRFTETPTGDLEVLIATWVPAVTR